MSSVVVKTRKFKRNPLLARKQVRDRVFCWEYDVAFSTVGASGRVLQEKALMKPLSINGHTKNYAISVFSVSSRALGSQLTYSVSVHTIPLILSPLFSNKIPLCFRAPPYR